MGGWGGGGQSFLDLNLWLAAENGMFLRHTRGEWMTTMPEHLNMEWVESVQLVFDYFCERTPRSYVEARETSLVWNYKYADVEFGRVQARDMLQHLWTGPISNAAVDVVQVGGSPAPSCHPAILRRRDRCRSGRWGWGCRGASLWRSALWASPKQALLPSCLLWHGLWVAPYWCSLLEGVWVLVAGSSHGAHSGGDCAPEAHRAAHRLRALLRTLPVQGQTHPRSPTKRQELAGTPGT